MDRREFIVSAAAVSVGVCAEGLAAAGAPFDPTDSPRCSAHSRREW